MNNKSIKINFVIINQIVENQKNIGGPKFLNLR